MATNPDRKLLEGAIAHILTQYVNPPLDASPLLTPIVAGTVTTPTTSPDPEPVIDPAKYELRKFNVTGRVAGLRVCLELREQPDITPVELLALWHLMHGRVTGNRLAYLLDSGLARHFEEIELPAGDGIDRALGQAPPSDLRRPGRSPPGTIGHQIDQNLGRWQAEHQAAVATALNALHEKEQRSLLGLPMTPMALSRLPWLARMLAAGLRLLARLRR